jgi:chromosome segregation ATPase
LLKTQKISSNFKAKLLFLIDYFKNTKIMSTSELLEKQMKNSKKPNLHLALDLEKIASSIPIEKALNEIFRFAFISNCHLDEASVTSEELETLDELSPEEIIENFKDLINELLNFKRDFRSTDKAELAQRTEQFENMLQKLEAEVRNHIRIEHQLKLHIENTQNKVEELEKYKLEADGKISKLEEMLKSQEKGKPQKPDNSKDKSIQKFEIECTKLKNLLEEKVKECEKLKKELEKNRKPDKSNTTSIVFLKKQLEDKAVELNKIQKTLREKADKESTRHVDRKNRKSLDENTRSTPSPFRPRKDVENNAVEYKPPTAKKSVPRTHMRSNSDQVRQLVSKKHII